MFSYVSPAQRVPKDHPLRAIYVHESSEKAGVQPAVNLTMLHGVRSSLALQKTGSFKDALAASNSDLAPHLSFVDVGGHGYCVVRASTNELEVEFVCIPRPLERSKSEDGGPLAYRIAHRVKKWNAGSKPQLERTKVEGTIPLFA